MSKKVYLKEEGRKSLMDGIAIIGNAVASTLGPTGKTVIIRKGDEKPTVTKDGVTVAKSIESDDPIEQISIMMVRETAINMDNDSGDGTTSATILCQNMIRTGMNSLSIKASMDMVSYCEGMKAAIDEAISYIDKKSEKVTIDDLEKLSQVGTISANNDEVLGKIIAEATQKAGTFGHVNIQDSNDLQTRIDILEGFIFDLGLADNAFANDREAGVFNTTNAVILLKNDKLIDKREWKTIVGAWQRQVAFPDLVIIAKDYSTEIVEMCKYYNSTVPQNKVCLIRNQMRDAEFNAIYDDISAYTAATIIEKFEYDDQFGSVKNITVKPGVTIIKDSEVDFSFHVEIMKDRVLVEKNSAIAESLKRRIGKFENGIVTVFVGGKSDVEVKEKKDRAVDAYNSCKAAINGGIVIGGGHLLLKFQNNTKIMDDPESAFQHGYKDCINIFSCIFDQIIENSSKERFTHNEISSCTNNDNSGLNFKTGMLHEDLLSAGVVDPKNTVINALLNAYSVASTILNTECVIL